MSQPISIVTLTGVDPHTDLDGVAELARTCPALEFGILLSRSQAGTPGRYGSLHFIRDTSAYLARQGVPIALHVCGSAVHAFIAGDDEIEALAAPFDRVQVNFNSQKTPVDPQALSARMDALAKPVITQHNPANAGLTLQVASPWHRVLFDASGGLGVREASWPLPLPGKTCGYAGGIGPATVAADIAAITALQPGDGAWIDMENSLRIDDRFDLGRCAEVVAALPEGLAPSGAAPASVPA